MKWTQNEYPIKELATGEVLTLKSYTATSDQPGPHIHIQASVHGAELQGNAVILHLMEVLNQIKFCGSITFIPLANPYATNNKHGTYTYGRYNPVTGDNWNRNYVDIIPKSGFDLKSFVKENKDKSWNDIKALYKKTLLDIFTKYNEELKAARKLSENNKLNLLLQEIAASADGILDLHTGPVATRYLYAADYELEKAFYLNFKHILVMPSEFGTAMDEAAFMPWIHLINELKEQGKETRLDIESFTLEFGSEETFCMKNGSKDVESILNYLRVKGLIDGPATKENTNTCSLDDFKTIFSPVGGLVDYHFEPGDKFFTGDVLASFYNMKKLDPKDPINSTRHQVKAVQDGIIINRCPSSSVHQGMELYQVMTNVKAHTFNE